MRERGDNTPYGFPDLQISQQLPASIPWDTPIAEMTGLSIEIQCIDHGTVDMPLRYLAAHIGHKRTLRTIVPKLKCRKCGSRPIRALLHQHNDAAVGAMERKARSLDL